jgi:hypothetical protein
MNSAMHYMEGMAALNLTWFRANLESPPFIIALSTV